MLAKKLMIVSSVIIASVALAWDASVGGAKGRGVAVNADGLRGAFNFEVKKATRANGEPEVGGKFVWEARVPATNTSIRIEMPRCREFGANERVAEFGGPAVMVVKRGNESKRFEGPLAVRVVDDRPKNAPPSSELRDKIRINFRALRSDVTYNFEGLVREGDIEVWRRP